MDLKDLEVYKLSEELSDMIWNIVIKWDYFAKETIGKQLVKAADSISANIAEGYGRYHYEDITTKKIKIFVILLVALWKKQKHG